VVVVGVAVGVVVAVAVVVGVAVAGGVGVGVAVAVGVGIGVVVVVGVAVGVVVAVVVAVGVVVGVGRNGMNEKRSLPTGDLYDAITASHNTCVVLVYDCGTTVLVDVKNGTARVCTLEDMHEAIGRLMLDSVTRAVDRAISGRGKVRSREVGR
jgi:hypothetical protein